MTSTIGFVGTGAMGSVMAERLLGQGWSLLVHNRTRAHAAETEAAGGEWVDSPSELAKACDVVIGCLRDSAAVEDVYLGPGGLLESASPGKTFVEHATFSPELARRVAAVANNRGSGFLDAPVTGGPEGARRAQLTVMVGGSADAFNVVKGILTSYSASVVHLGGSGRGLELKLVNQLLVSVHMGAAAEAIALLSSLGHDIEQSAGVLLSGWAQSAMLDRAVAQVASNDLTRTGVTIAGMVEVLQLVASATERAALHTSIFHAARDLFTRALSEGSALADPAALSQVVTNERESTREEAV